MHLTLELAELAITMHLNLEGANTMHLNFSIIL